MTGPGGIRPARPHELTVLGDIEARAGQRFRDHGLPEVADAPPIELSVHREALDRGCLWVSVDPDDQPVGFALAIDLDGDTHLAEVSVVPEAQGHGRGSALVAAVVARARARGHRRVTLTTFSDLPWNGPWYRRQGFVPLAPSQWGPDLRAMRAAETRSGLDAARREVLAREL